MLCTSHAGSAWMRGVVVAVLAAMAIVAAGSPAAAQASLVGPNIAIFSRSAAPFITNGDVGFDPVNRVYLTVAGQGSIWYQFVSEDGVVIGSVQALDDQSVTGRYTFTPRVEYSAAVGGFLVTWNGTLDGRTAYVYGAFVKYNTPGQPATFTISPAGDPVNWLWGPDVAYSTTSQEFLVVWHGAYGSTNDVRAQRVSTSGALLGSMLVITSDGDYQREPSVAYNPQTNEFMVAYAAWLNAANYGAVSVRRVQAGTGVMPAAPIELRQSALGDLIPDIVYNPSTGGYHLVWVEATGRGAYRYYGLQLQASGAASGAVIAESSSPAAYDALNLAYNSTSGMIAMVGHGQGVEDVMAELYSSSGLPTSSSMMNATQTGATKGSYFPRIASHSGRAEWMLVTSKDFVLFCGQRIGTATRDPGGQPPPPPPPPPPPTKIDMSVSSAPNGSWVFAEGALGFTPPFLTYYLIANENSGPVRVRCYFVRQESATLTVYETTVPALTRKTIDLLSVVAGASGTYSAVIQSIPSEGEGIPPGLQIYVGRAMYWGGSSGVLTGPGHEKTGTFVAPGAALPTQWYFAEGTRLNTPGGLFDSFYMVFNPNQAAASVTVDFIADAGAGVLTTLQQSIPAQGRWTISAASIAALNGKNFSVRVASGNGVGVLAERSMYWGSGWSAGHSAVGSPSAAADWYFAEGTAMPGFNTYYLLLNPNPYPATVDVTYHLSPLNGTPQQPVLKTYTLPSNSRTTVFLGNEVVGMQTGVASEFHARAAAAIVVERSMYWGTGWTEGSTVMAASAPAAEWHLPEGSTMSGYETYLLLSNPNTTTVTVVITTFSDAGVKETQTADLPAKTRLTLWMNNQALSNGMVFSSIINHAFSTRVMSSTLTPLPVVAEQAVYWTRVPGAGQFWRGGDATMGSPVIR